MSPFHRVIDEFMIQGGDVTNGNGTGGASIYGGEFEDENIGWREIDKEGLVCMANRSVKNTNTSQSVRRNALNMIGLLIRIDRFFITLAPCPHINAKHTVFGQLVSGQDTLERIAKVTVDKDDKPLQDVIISTCGELERKQKPAAPKQAFQGSDTAMVSSTSRGRHKRRHSTSASRSRSPPPSRGHTRRSASRHRHRHRTSQREGSYMSSGSTTPPARNRRRSDALPDHNLRGRLRQRSRSQSPITEKESADDDRERKHRKRSPPPSRPQSRSRSPGHRRQRSLPNQYKDWRDDGRSARRDRNREGDRYSYRNDDSSGRLGGGGDFDDLDATGGVKYKGRGHMKFSERDLQPRQQQGRRRW